MASTASPSLKLELMATGDQSGTWGDTTNTNLGTLLEQAITGYEAIAKVGTGDYTLSNTDYAANENRNAIIEFTGTPGGAFNVIVPLAEKLWVFKNSTNGAMTVKGSTGTGVTVATSTSRWLYCDGTNVLDALTGTLATQAASGVAITGGTITGLTSLTLASGAATPATNNAAALGTTSLQWADLFLASGGVINFDNGDVTLTHSSNTLTLTASSGLTVNSTRVDTLGQGQHTIFVPAGAMTPATTNGAARGTGESTTNKVMRSTLDFDASTEEFAQFFVQMPKSWNESTLIAQFIWSHPSTTTNFGVAWGIEAVALADGDALDTAWGTEIATTDTGGTTDDIYISAESSAITVAGSPGNEEFVLFRVTRVVGNGSDTMAVDARLHGVKLHYTTNAATDD